MIKIRRMCGGGMWKIPGYRLRFWEVRLVPGAVIFDWPGVAVAWGADW